VRVLREQDARVFFDDGAEVFTGCGGGVERVEGREGGGEGRGVGEDVEEDFGGEGREGYGHGWL